MSTTTKPKVLITFWPADRAYYDDVIVPKFSELDLQLSPDPIMSKEDFTKDILSLLIICFVYIILFDREESIEGVSAIVHATVKIPMDEAAINALPSSVKIIANHGAGYDGVNVPAATKKGIWVSNTPDAVNDSTADIAFILILNSTRRVYEAEQHVRSGEWVDKKLNDFMMGHLLRGKKLGIVGMGGIGKELAKRARAFGMEILYYNRNRLDSAEEEKYSATYCSSLSELLSLSHVISVHTPYSPETHHMFGVKEFQQMRKGAYIVNTARGKVIDTDALVEALRSGHLAGAGLDVFEVEPMGDRWPELRAMKNVTLLPHLGTCTYEARSQMLELCLDNVSAVLKQKAPVSPVNKI